MQTETLSTIKIKNKEVYLMTDIDTGQFRWTKRKSEALAFNTDHQAKAFANKYFKRYKDWEIGELEVSF